MKATLKTTNPNIMPSIKQRFTRAQVKEAIEKCNGRWAAIVAYLNCSYAQLRVWFEHHKDQEKLADDLRMAFVAEAEEQIWALMHSTDANMRADIAKFVLKTYGKSRGWNEASNVQQININDKDVSIQQIFGL